MGNGPVKSLSDPDAMTTGASRRMGKVTLWNFERRGCTGVPPEIFVTVPRAERIPIGDTRCHREVLLGQRPEENINYSMSINVWWVISGCTFILSRLKRESETRTVNVDNITRTVRVRIRAS